MRARQRRIPTNLGARFAIAVLVLTSLAVSSGATTARADDDAAVPEQPEPRVYRQTVRPQWIGDSASFWYVRVEKNGGTEYIRVDPDTKTRQPAFDHDRLAKALSAELDQSIPPTDLPITSLYFPDQRTAGIHGKHGSWRLDLNTYELTSDLVEPDDRGLPLTLEPRPSGQSGAETEITFLNQWTETIQVYWSDGSSGRHLYATLEPGGRHAQHTFAGHVWVVTEMDETVVAVFEGASKPNLAIVDGRAPDRDNNAAASTKDDSPHGEDSELPRLDGIRTPSPDGHWSAFVRDSNLWIRDETPDTAGDRTSSRAPRDRQVSLDGSEGDGYQKNSQRERLVEMRYTAPHPESGIADVLWSPNSQHLLALRIQTVPEHSVYMVEAAPENQLQPTLHSYPYLRPGDEIPVRRPRLFDAVQGREIPLDDSLFADPWDLYEYHWNEEGTHCYFVYNQRGHQVLRVIEIEASTGKTRAMAEEMPDTFVDYSTKFFIHHLEASNEFIWMSERDGWNHLYLFDRKKGRLQNRITQGDWVVREVDRVDESTRQIWFRASGLFPGADPYHIHHCRIGLDGSDFVVLTAGQEDSVFHAPTEPGWDWVESASAANGNHVVGWAPDSTVFVDTWYRVDQPPVHVLRNGGTGEKIVDLEVADATDFDGSGRMFPEPFVAKGRDGETEIYGVIHRPRHFDPTKTYPVIEQIYAGPHGHHVPKNFRPLYRNRSLADRGFIVVQIDGMGTNWRSKAFLDVAWQNLADGGFLDRIAWIRAAATVYPEMDISQVGIYGGSAGGQNAVGGLLTHPDFYKIGVADCGCHDNRMDKIWWNEAWMGYPVGAHYREQSNVTLASNLEGELLLIVGELDRNVDPASTMQMVDALVTADKDFDMLVMPGIGHGAAGTEYGRRRLEEFFVRHLK